MDNESRLYKTVLNQMLELIESGEFPVGGRLPPERELAEKFNVSRPTIREAIIALETLNRVQVKTGSGVYVLGNAYGVKVIDENISAYELTEARALIEGEAAALAATLITDEELLQLRDALFEMADENKVGNIAEGDGDKNFHILISEATRNSMLKSIIDHMWHVRDHSPQIRQAYTAICEQDGQRRIEEHEEIYNALLKRDPHAARSAMHLHFARILNKLIAVIEAEQVEEVRRKALESRNRFSLGHLVQAKQ